MADSSVFHNLKIHIVQFLIIVCFASPSSANSNSADSSKIEEKASVKTVYFNAWGGDPKINSFIEWAGNRVREEYKISLVHVKLSNTASAVSRILSEKVAGREKNGTVDLLWVNGENFSAMKSADLLLDHSWANTLPNWRYTDSDAMPGILFDFAEPTDGKESPWGRAQLVFAYDKERLKNPPKSAEELLKFIKKNPGRFTFPQPPDFVGVSFLKQILIELTGSDPALYRPVSESDFDVVTANLWKWLDTAKDNLWRKGKTYPSNYSMLRQLLADKEVDIAISFNPSDASAAIARGELPDTIRTYIHRKGTLANVHFLAIPFNSSDQESAKKVANFLLSPEAQLKKADSRVWGDPTVLSMPKLSKAERFAFLNLPRGIATLDASELSPTLTEPHPSWVPKLESAWMERYASGK